MKHLRLLAALIALACTPAFAQVTPGSSPATVAKGGTGRASLDAHKLVFGAGTSPVTLYGCTGFLVGTGSSVDPTCRAIGASDLPANLTSFANLSGSTGKVPYFTAASTLSMFDSTAYGRSLSNAADASALRTLAGSVIGTNVQAWDADLDAVAGLSTNGLIARTGSGTTATRTVTAPAAGITISNGDGVSGNPTLGLANDLAAVEGLSCTGVAVRTAADTWACRTAVGTANEITVANGDGVSGAPAISLPNTLTFTGKTVTGGQFNSPGITTPTGIVKGDVGLGNVDNTSDATKWAATKTLTNTMFKCDGTGNVCLVRLGSDVSGTLPKANGGLGATTLSSALDTEFSSTQGTILYRNATAWVALSPGTAGQFLTTQGAGANPNWSGGGAGTGTVTQVSSGSGLTGGPITTSGTLALDINGLTEDTSPDRSSDFVATYDVSGSANKKVNLSKLSTRVLLNTITASGQSALQDTTSFTSEFQDYEIVLENLVPSTPTSAYIQVYSGGVYQGSNYSGSTFISGSANANATQSWSTAAIWLTRQTTDIDTVAGISGRYTFFNVNSISARKHFSGLGSVSIGSETSGGIWSSTSAIAGFQFILNSATISSGTIKVYGLR